MVQPQHVGAAKLERLGDGVADDGRAQVADVHFFGDVGRRKVDDNLLAPELGRRPSLEALGGAEHGVHAIRQPLLVEPDVDKSRSSEACLRDHRVLGDVGQDGLGHGPRVLRAALDALDTPEQGHGVVALVVSVGGIVACGHEHVKVRAQRGERRLDGRREERLELLSHGERPGRGGRAAIRGGGRGHHHVVELNNSF